MNTSLFKYSVSTIGFTLFTASVSGFSAQAETKNFAVHSSEAIAFTTGAEALISPTPISDTAFASKTESSSEATTDDTAPLMAQFGDFGYNGRSRFSLGVSGNIGITGDTAMGDSSFSLNSRIGLTNNLSVRPSVGFTDDVNFTIPLTFDFPLETTPDVGFSVVPYLGGGVIITTGDNGEVNPMATAGVDIPLIDQLGASAEVNVGFLDETQVGISLGVSYSF
jgi:hypothetical protein